MRSLSWFRVRCKWISVVIQCNERPQMLPYIFSMTFWISLGVLSMKDKILSFRVICIYYLHSFTSETTPFTLLPFCLERLWFTDRLCPWLNNEELASSPGLLFDLWEALSKLWGKTRPSSIEIRSLTPYEKVFRPLFIMKFDIPTLVTVIWTVTIPYVTVTLPILPEFLSNSIRERNVIRKLNSLTQHCYSLLWSSVKLKLITKSKQTNAVWKKRIPTTLRKWLRLITWSAWSINCRISKAPWWPL